MSTTLTDRGSEPVHQVRLILYVLNYDNLRAQSDASFVRCDQELLVGRAMGMAGGWMQEGGALRLADEWLSQSHARIVKKAQGDVLIDLGSKNGTFANGVRVREHVLADHDLIEVGHSLLCYRSVEQRLADVLATTDRHFGPTLTRSPEVAMLLHNLRTLAVSPRPVLLLGETGTGKELAARLLHEWSGRTGEYATVDCGAVPDTLFESLFFGHVRGAFTGAVSGQEGVIARADRGTLFLDEVGNLSEAAQAKLLRAMQETQITRLGAQKSQPVDVRWVAATNSGLHDPQSSFRRDLLRRLGTTQQLPPLRHRREDLGELCAHFLNTEPTLAAFPETAITAEAGRRLFCGPLPGNIRQLREALLSAALLARKGPISEQHILSADMSLKGSAPVPLAHPRSSQPSREELAAALLATNGNKTAAAQRLGTSVRQLHRWLKRADS